MFFNRRTNKSVIMILLSLFVFVDLFGLLFFIRPAHAQMPVSVTADAPRSVSEVKSTVGSMILSAAMSSLVNGVSYFLRRLAYDSAMYIATGGSGQGALAFKDGFGSYLKQTALDASASAIDTLGEPFGLGLCTPPDIRFQIQLQIGLRSIYADPGSGPKPSCTWSQMTDAWSPEAIEEKYKQQLGINDGQFFNSSKFFADSIKFNQTDFGVTLGAMSSVDRIKAGAETGAQAERLEGQGFKSLTSLISGKIKTPAQNIREEAGAVTNKEQARLNAQATTGAFASGMKSAVMSALSVFLNTLVSQGIKTAQEKLLELGEDSDEAMQGVLSFDADSFSSSRRIAEEVFSDIMTANIGSKDNYDLVLEFNTCPVPPMRPGLNNCVIDDKLRTALTRDIMDDPLTIERALQEGLLYGDWTLVSPLRVSDNQDPKCYLNKYCYSNIQKLRRNRILPLGFEIAALLADPDHPEKEWTLAKVVAGYDDCKYDAQGNVIPDQVGHPHCRLIDPNWILKLPETRCNSLVYATNLLDDTSGVRAQECVDFHSCLKTNLDGSCASFGYCTREQNVWRLAGDGCPEQYNTCSTYVTKDTGKTSSYLNKTLDYGDCSVDNIGCLAYSTEKNKGEWVASSQAEGEDYQLVGRNQTLYFNSRAANYFCAESDVGCQALYLARTNANGTYQNYRLANDLVYLKKAPAYLGCYDFKPNTPETDWPKTKTELAQVKPNEECSLYSNVCIPEEVGCDLFVPQSGNQGTGEQTEVPGVVGPENICAKECVGYDAYKQVETNFSPAEFPLYFNPNNGTVCEDRYAGCDEFTNIDKLTKGGEGLEYYTDLKYCEVPNEQNQKVYYSWEGSAAEGYILKTHTLRPVLTDDFNYINSLVDLDLGEETANQVFPIGSPAYYSDKKSELENLYDLCNAADYNDLVNGKAKGGQVSVECRALYDKSGNVFYRLLANTITVNSACHPLRKTVANFYYDEEITQTTLTQLPTLPPGEKNFCEKKGGRWEENSCELCYNGGFYENESCVYWTISAPGESDSCPASANGCRQYKGNLSNNPIEIVSLDFEPDKTAPEPLLTAIKGWETTGGKPLKVAPEAIQVGLYSLQVDSNVVYYTLSENLKKDDWYLLSFWVRGNTQNLDIYLSEGGANNSLGQFTFDTAKNKEYQITVGSDWQQYILGPVRYEGDGTASSTLVFARSDQGVTKTEYYIDNLKLKRISDTVAVVKDSWKKDYNNDGKKEPVPSVCDANPNDLFPGDALGCKEYLRRSNNQMEYLTGFEKLCREEAVGCQAVYDTYNTYQSKEEHLSWVYNLWCDSAVVGTCQLMTASGENLGECVVEQGKDGCYVDQAVVLPEGVEIADIDKAEITPATVIIPADGDDKQTIFLTRTTEMSCTSDKVGCQKIALEEQVLPNTVSSSYKFELEVTLLNNPKLYDEILCRHDLIGCREFVSGGQVSYFKDPLLTGNSFCEYKENVDVGGAKQKGWFKTGIGQCQGTDKLCTSSGDCGAD
ncbi:MAG TPA: hypothetical protein VJB37_01465, partial [Patescibacteria group bacterium]|nr:hypothetical protein [Patescibacteria group bacterium]